MNTTQNTSFNDIGFLSEECTTTDIAQQVTSSECYKICTNLNRLAQSVLNHAVVHPDDRKEVYAILYFQRMLSHYQAILIMAERCMAHQLEILLRALMEVLFDLVAFHQHDDFFDVLILGDSEQRLAFLKQIREQQRTVDSYTSEEIDDLEKIIASAEDVDRSDFKVYIKADLAGMLNEYRTTYSLLSETVHSAVHSIEVDLVLNPETREIEGVNAYSQKAEDIEALLMTTANYMLLGLNMILQTMPNTEGKAKLESLSDEVQGEWQHVVAAVSRR